MGFGSVESTQQLGSGSWVSWGVRGLKLLRFRLKVSGLKDRLLRLQAEAWGCKSFASSSFAATGTPLPFSVIHISVVKLLRRYSKHH